MLRWHDFEREAPELAEAGRVLFYQVAGVGLAFLSTVRRDGGPRVHPVCPLIADGGLFAFLIPSPKQHDLRRDGRYALHSFPTPSNEDAFYLAGVAQRRTDSEARAAVASVFMRERGLATDPPGFEDQWLYEFYVDTCLLTRTDGYGDYNPRHTVWKAGRRASS